MRERLAKEIEDALKAIFDQLIVIQEEFNRGNFIKPKKYDFELLIDAETENPHACNKVISLILFKTWDYN